MSNWFECKVKYQKVDENGKQKGVSELYMVDAVSFTDAESRITKELEDYAGLGEFIVASIKTTNYAEIIPNESGDRWFKCKAVFISFDEKSGKERRTSSSILVQATDVKDAYEVLSKALSTSISDFTIPMVQESSIMDIFGILHDFDKEPTEEEN
ncbi:MAG: DUF4494 domain-containing protein [Salinivirgaceae bacterium]|nr:DUF4494 domain-containing protein [Salinivirgaceae bacterium]